MNEEFSLYAELMAGPKTNEPTLQDIHYEDCLVPVEFYTGNSLKYYSGNESCKLYSDWMDLVYSGEKHTRDEWVGIIESALKPQYPDAENRASLVDELIDIDVGEIGALKREGGLIWW